MTDSKLQELKAEAEERRYEVKLIKPHTHAGEELQPGDTLKVTAAQRGNQIAQQLVGTGQ